MASTRFIILKKREKKDGTCVIYARVQKGNKTIRINTGVSVPYLQFDQKKGRIKGSSKKIKDDNLIIDNCLARINEIETRYRLQHKPLTAELLLREYKNPSYYVDFYLFMETKIEERFKNREIGKKTSQNHTAALNKLKEFKATLNFAEIDKKFIEGFQRRLRRIGNGINTIHKTLSNIGVYMNIAVQDEIIDSNPLELMVFGRVAPNRVFLTEPELRKLIFYYDNNRFGEHLHRTLRHFLFMCLTGVRISDFQRLKKENVHDNNLKFIPFKTRAKKQIEITVPLIEKARNLIKDENWKMPELFNTISDQKYNDQLKDIADLAGIKKELTNHSARHTFATQFIEKTSDVATLQRILGHSNIKETMVYVHISTRKITDQMQNFDRLMKLEEIENPEKPTGLTWLKPHRQN